MKVEYNEETSVRKSLSFEIDAEVVQREIEARSRDYAKKVKLPGFRPGKIPPHVIKQRFRQQVLEDVAEKLVNKVVYEEIEGRGLKPVAAPRVTDLKIDENAPLTFRAVFETLPIVDLPDYRGLEVKARTPFVTEEEVDRELERLREDAARYDPVEGRASREGDFVLLDLQWEAVKPEAEAARGAGSTPAEHAGVQGGAARRPLAHHDENALVEVGAEGNHPDLNAALVAVSEGDAKEVRVAYPAEPPGALAGQTVDYRLTVKGVKEKVLPALDDEFAKDLGKESLADLRQQVRDQLEAVERRKADRELKNALVDALVQRAHFEVPEALVERHMSLRTESAARGLAFQGIDPTKAGVDWRQYREAQREEAVKGAKADILLDEIARREGIESTDAEVDAEVERFAERTGRPKDVVRARMEKEGDLESLRARIREDKVLDLLRAGARLSSE